MTNHRRFRWPRTVVFDAGPLYASVDEGDPQHTRAIRVLQTPGLRIVVPTLIVAEVLHLNERDLGPDIEARFLRQLARLEIVPPHPEDWLRAADLVETYRDFPLGGADASVVALAERLGTDAIATFDHRHFAAIRPRHVHAFRLLPD